jgi:DNA-binding NarL/FixJ family response regulator
MTPLRLLLADDVPAVRRNLAENSQFVLAGEASTGKDAVRQALALRPDAVLMDYRMPEMDGVAAATRILESDPNIAIFLTSLSFERQYVMRALAAGARGYIAKDDALASLDAVRDAILTRRMYLSPSVAELIARTAPPDSLELSQQVLFTFDREAPSLLACASGIADETAAEQALTTAFQAYWLACREGHPVADPQTWLLLSLAALLFPARDGAPPRWSFTRTHPEDRELRRPTARLLEHVSACRACFLAFTLASHDPRTAADVTALRGELVHSLEVRDEAQLFLAFAERQAAVMRLAASELQVLLGSQAGKSWMQREVSAGAWLGAFLGGASSVRAEAERT